MMLSALRMALTLPLERKVELLRDPCVYPDHPTRVDTIETHMSWVFLTDAYTYKLKKPVRYDFLDFSTLAARERNCREELRLNQRLAPGVYLALVPLTITESGVTALGGAGRIVEFLIKMRRLPAARMLDRLIQTRQLRASDIAVLARVVANFYRESAPVKMKGVAYRAQCAQMIGLNRAVLSSPQYCLPRQIVAQVHDRLLLLLNRSPEIFERRADENHIVEGHGDLRPEHVCLTAPPVVFDRLEFNRELRLLDPIEEISFLGMECERLGAAFVAPMLLDAYRDATHDDPPWVLSDFYKAQRACIRARLAVLHTLELARPNWDRWLNTAIEYLYIADGYCRRL